MGVIISLPVSILLLWLVLKPKKNDPFPKGGLARLVIAGLLCTFVAGILSQVFSLILVAIRIGPANLTEVINKLRSDMAGATELMQSLSPKGRSPLWTLFTTLITGSRLSDPCDLHVRRSVRRYNSHPPQSGAGPFHLRRDDGLVFR